MEVILVDEIHECGEHDDGERYAGCARVTSDGNRDFAEIRIVDGYAPEVTRETLKHEFGHVLGLGHDDEPAHVMSDRIEDRIPHFQERTDILDLYADAITAWNDGIREWETGVANWNEEDYRSAELDFRRAVISYQEAASPVEEAVTIAEDIEQREAADLLGASEKKNPVAPLCSRNYGGRVRGGRSG